MTSQKANSPAPPDDWWDRLYAPQPVTPGRKPKKSKRRKGKAAQPPAAQGPAAAVKAGAVQVAAATTKVMVARLPKVRRLRRDRLLYVAYNGAAAGLGWALPLGPWLASCLVYYIPRPPAGWIVLGVLATTIVVVDSRTHHLRGPGRHLFARLLGWAGRIPLASTILAIALYKTR